GKRRISPGKENAEKVSRLTSIRGCRELGIMITDPRYWPALIGSFLMDLPAMGGPFKVWPMKAASVLFGCVGVAGSAQEEDEVCEDIFAEKCSANYSFWQFW